MQLAVGGKSQTARLINAHNLASYPAAGRLVLVLLLKPIKYSQILRAQGPYPPRPELQVPALQAFQQSSCQRGQLVSPPG